MPVANIKILEDTRNRLQLVLDTTNQEIKSIPVEKLGSEKSKLFISLEGEVQACLIAVNECLSNYT